MAARYRKIDPRIWNDETFRALTDDGKFVFLFLLTHPHMTALGAMRGTTPGLAAELGWSVKRFASAMQQTITQGIAEASERASWISLPNFLRYNEPEGPNSVVKAWVAALELLPECPEKARLIHRCRAYLNGKSDAFKDAMGNAIWDAFPEPSDIQEQEQEQEQENSPLPPQGAAASLTRLQPEEIRQRWNAIQGVKPCKMLGETIRDRIRTRLKTHPDLAWWEELFRQVRSSNFLCGRINGARGPFQASLEWALRPTNCDKILAGSYDNAQPTRSARLPL